MRHSIAAYGADVMLELENGRKWPSITTKPHRIGARLICLNRVVFVLIIGLCTYYLK